MERKEVILPIIFAITLSLGFSYQDAAATILYSDPYAAISGAVDWTTLIVSDDFVLTSPETVTDIHFHVVQSGPPNSGYVDGNIIYTIYQDTAGQPGAVIDTGSLVNVVAVFDPLDLSCNCYFVRGDLPISLPLAAGTYWVGLQGIVPSSGVIFDQTPVGASALSSDDGGNTWSSPPLPQVTVGIPLEITGPTTIGGSDVAINTSALLLAGVQSISMWMIPVILAGIGIGVFVIKRKK